MTYDFDDPPFVELCDCPEHYVELVEDIEIEHIKGIQHKRFVLDISPNKPSLLVAPNGFRERFFGDSVQFYEQQTDCPK